MYGRKFNDTSNGINSLSLSHTHTHTHTDTHTLTQTHAHTHTHTHTQYDACTQAYNIQMCTKACTHRHVFMTPSHSHRANEAKEEKVKCYVMFDKVCFNHNLHLKFVNREISLLALLIHSRLPTLCSHIESLPSSYFHTTIFITSGLCHIHAIPVLAVCNTSDTPAPTTKTG